MNEQQSLQLIHQMIANARGQIKDDGYFYLLWGWLIVSASLIHYGLLDLDQPLFIGGIWIIALTIGVIASYIVGKRRAKQTQVRPYTLDLVLYLWIGLGSCFFLILGMAFTATLTFEVAYPLFMMLYGLGAFISGGVLRFSPLIFGAIGAWLLTIIAFFVPFDIQLLLLASSIVSAYLVPGYLLRRRS
ncbi:MAG: hypothetical protein AAFQ83_00295 [Bacteroidota bacterium]